MSGLVCQHRRAVVAKIKNVSEPKINLSYFLCNKSMKTEVLYNFQIVVEVCVPA